LKLAMIGSYGHWNLAANSARAAGLELVAAAKWGEADPLPYAADRDGLAVYEADDWAKMLDEHAPDVVGVFTPLYRLAEASRLAVERGCHVLSEKPLATTREDLAELRAAVDAAGVQVSACFNMRGMPSYRAARNAVADGRIGRPVLVSGQKSYPFARRDDFYKRRETYGGSIPWAAIHAIDFVRWCSGQEYTRVAAMHSNAAHPAHGGMEDNGAMLFGLSGGGHATVRFDYLRPWEESRRGERRWGDDRLRIVGTEGIVEVVDEGARAVLMTPTDVADLPPEAPAEVLVSLAAAIRGEGEPLVSTADSFRVTDVALRARDAADAGQIVEL